MGWKLVRDRNEEWCRANGVSGQWRTSPDPVAALRRKIFEEAAEYAEQCDANELYDLLDVTQALASLDVPDPVPAALYRAVQILIGAPDDGPAGLRGLLDATQTLIGQADPDSAHAAAHAAKIADLGGFSRFIEWTPVPAGTQDWNPARRASTRTEETQ